MIKQIKTPGDMPKDAQYMIIVFTKHSVDIPGDNRSDGHGYSAETQYIDGANIVTATTWEDVEALLDNLHTAIPNRKDILVLQGAMPLDIVIRLSFVVRL